MNTLYSSSVLLLGIAIGASSALADTFNVYCVGSGDRPAIQNAIDMASHNDVVHIHGVCQLDGERLVIDKSHVTIRGDASDIDNDGRMDQWDTVLKGNGNIDDLLAGPYTNLGFHIGAVPANDDDIEDVVIEHLQFQDFYLALTVSPGVLAEENLHCDALQVTDARASQVNVRNNRFVDNANHFFLYGGAKSTRFEYNQVEGGGGIPLASATFALGKRTICLADPDTGATSSIAIGMSDNLVVNDNRFTAVATGTGLGDLELVNARNSRIEANDFEGDAQPLFLFGAINTEVEDNLMLDSELEAVVLINAQDTVLNENVIQTAGTSGVFTLDLPPTHPVVQLLGLPPSLDNRILCNHIEGATNQGLIIIDGVNRIEKNRFSGNGLDILLLAPGNEVEVGPADTVVDASGGNDITVDIKESRCAPEF
ncbi:MAG: right-handed parallel beta-helix repeat-containing protein [Woeseiaceae bacterium]|nr:right-handed parallel beta-helix repeat-containing protein [Woeseiaceae bacterium]